LHRISIIVPCRNEKAHIEPFLASLLSQKLPAETELEVLIADGFSTDGTKEKLQEYAARHPWIQVLENPGRVVSTGLNRAIARASGDTIIRMDVHARYAEDYVEQCLAVLAETGADNVGGPAQTRARGYVQQAISAAYHSSFACGGARFHDINYEGEVDTVTFGCWRKDTFNKMGVFDEQLVRNQDDELNLRLTRMGGRIFQSPRIRCWYEPRASLRTLARQYSQYGYWKVRVIRKHRSPAALRHLVPAVFVGSILVLALASIFSTAARWSLGAVLGAYVVANLAASVVICGWRRLCLFPVTPIVLAIYHFSYGLGFLGGLVDPGVNPSRNHVRATPKYSER
jgi:glycosyltransferase involved in cell wall biosynthesis